MKLMGTVANMSRHRTLLQSSTGFHTESRNYRQRKQRFHNMLQEEECVREYQSLLQEENLRNWERSIGLERDGFENNKTTLMIRN